MDALERPDVVVHIFSDDPDYLDRYALRWQDEFRHHQPPRVCFGPFYNGPTTDRSAAASSMVVPRPVRRTAVVDFAVELCIMVQANAFMGTTGSSVATMVEGLRKATALPDRHCGTIGRWPVPTRCTQEAAECIQRLAAAFVKVRFDPEGLEILPEQRAVLDLLMPHVLQKAQDYLEQQLARGIVAMSVLGRGVLDAHQTLASNRDKFRSAVPDSAAGKRWLSAMLAYRMNPFLTQMGKNYKYETDGKTLSKVDTAAAPAASPQLAAPASGAGGCAATRSAAAHQPRPTSAPASPERRRAAEGSAKASAKKRPRVVAPPPRPASAAEGGVTDSANASARPLMVAKSKHAPPRPPR